MDKLLFLTMLTIVIVPVLSFIVNFVMFFNCDFNFIESAKCEIVHWIWVVIPPLSIVTVWVK